jgi:uncharacterized membrane protein YdbT with pleckstrin-like domain
MTPTTLEPPPQTKKLREPKGVPQRYLAEGLTGETGAEEAAARAAGMLPAELLQPGEIIILLLKPSPWFILLAPLRILTAIVILAIAADSINSYLQLHVSSQNIYLAAMFLLLARVFWQFLEWLSRVYVLTDRRVIAVAGVLRVGVFETPLEKIQHTNLHFSLRERLFALGTISFATAGTAFTEAWWVMLSNPLEVHQKVVQTLSRYRR